MLQCEAVVFTAIGEVDVRPVTLPDPGPRDLVIRTEVSGISAGTERWCLLGKYRGIADQFPFVPGYQRAGIVEWVGPEVTGWKVGQAAFGALASFVDPELVGKPYGAHTGYSVVSSDDDRLLPIPNGLDLGDVSLSALAAVSMNGITMAAIQAGETVVVLGLGLIGQMAAQLARARGAYVIGVDPVAARRALAEGVSVDEALDAIPDLVLEQTRIVAPEGVDVAIDTSGRSDVVSLLVELIRPYGRICFQGWYPDALVIDHHPTHIKRPTILFPCDWVQHGQILQMMSAGDLRIGPLITDRVPYKAAREVYARLASGDPAMLGAVIEWADQPRLDL